MAKKRKGSRKAASRRKTATTRGGSRKSAAVRMKGNRLDLRPLKRNIKAHIDRLRRIKAPDPKVREAIDSLTRTQSELSDACFPTMEIELGEQA